MEKALLRFKDLKTRRIVNSHAQLKNLLDEEKGCFPPGAWIGANTHVWTEEEIDLHVQTLQLVETGATAKEIAKATGQSVKKAQAYIDMVGRWRLARRAINKGRSRRKSPVSPDYTQTT